MGHWKPICIVNSLDGETVVFEAVRKFVCSSQKVKERLALFQVE